MAFRRLHQAFKHLSFPATKLFTRGRRLRALAAPERLGIGLYGMEFLERRVMLTEVAGGSVFEYRQTNEDDDILVRVKLDGNIRAELIGATVNRRNNEITLGNLSGQLDGVDVGNGIFGGIGLDVIGNLQAAGVGNNISAIAAVGPGRFYAFVNAGFGGGSNLVRLTLPPTDTNGFVTDGPVTATLIGNVPFGNIGGADFGPDGDLYFVSGLTLFSLTLNTAGDNIVDFSTIGGIGPLDPPDDDVIQNVGSIAFVNNDLFVIVNEIDDDGTATSFLLDVDPTSGFVNDNNEIDIDDTGEGPIVGLDVDNQGNLIAIQANGADPDDDPDQTVIQLFPNGTGFVLGPLTAPGEAAGENSSAMSFVSGVIDPFTGSASGAFIGFDNLTNEFFFVNATDRLPAQFLWNVYVTQSDLTGKIAIGMVDDDIFDDEIPSPFVIRPFEGPAPTIRAFHAQNGEEIRVSGGDATGAVIIGALSQDINPDTDDDENNPYPAQPIPTDVAFTALPPDVDNLAPGLVVEDGQDLGKFLLGGTFTGAVDAHASLDFFYAGWVITGDAGGIFDDRGVTIEDNFKVAGDLRSSISRHSIGGDGGGPDTPNYLSGFDLQVGGALGTVRSYNRFDGHVEVNHFNNAPRIQNATLPNFEIQKESEYHSTSRADGFENWHFGPSDGFAQPNGSHLGGPNNFMFNDTFETAEYLGSISSTEYGRSEMIRVEGLLQKTLLSQEDNADYYGVALMAGQTVTVRVRANFLFFSGTGVVSSGGEQPKATGFIHLGVFDPDGRLIATDYNNTFDVRATQRDDETAEQFLTFKADRPGIYRFAVAGSGDAPDFGFVSADFSGQGVFTTTSYTLTAVGVGDIAFGGLVADSHINDLVSSITDPGYSIFRGDMGAMHSIGGNIVSNSFLTMQVGVGNLRAVDAAGNLGGLNADDFIFEVPEGSVGLMRAGGALLVLNRLIPLNLIKPIGGDVQLVDGPAATVQVALKADKAIGVIRAGNMATSTPSVLEVNADDIGRDGVIDLIDVAGDFGAFGPGGPQITTHTGGNVRYIRVGGSVFGDTLFSNTAPENTLYAPGKAATIIDDSGSRITFRSAGEPIPNPFFDPGFPNAGVDEFIGSRINLVTYPIRGSAGHVVINATSESGMTINVDEGPTAEIGRIEIAGVGRAVLNGTIDPDPSTDAANLDGVVFTENNTTLDPDSPTGVRQSLVLDPRDLTTAIGPEGQARMSPDDFFLRITGSAVVDILTVIALNNGGHDFLDIDGNVEVINLGDVDAARPVALGNPVSIANNTGGDLVNVVAATVGELSSKGNLGLARSTTGTIVEGLLPLSVGTSLSARTPATPRPDRAAGNVGDAQPFLGMREGIMIGGNVITMRAGGAIGNVVVNGGTIDEVIANADNTDDPNIEFEGINGTIYVARGETDIFSLPGRVNRVRIGEGILSSGTGNFQRAGIVVDGQIGIVTGENADIRGDLIALNTYRVQQFTTITVTVGTNTQTQRRIINPPHASIERVTLNNGSIINADILATSGVGDSREFVGLGVTEFSDLFTQPDYEIGKISIRGNGGIIGTSIVGADINVVEVANGGFGIFNTNIRVVDDGTINRVEASGYGIRKAYIRGGRVNEISAKGDGTSLSTNAIRQSVRLSEGGSTDPKIRHLDEFFGFESNGLSDIHAFLGTNATQPEISGVTDTGILDQLTALGPRDIKMIKGWQIRNQSSINFANSVGALQIRDIINGLELKTGTLKNFSLKQDAFALTVTVAGRVKKIDIQGSLANNSVIRTQGEGGQIDTLNVRGNLIGNIDSARAIKSINIGGDFTGNITVSSPGAIAIKTIKVGGSFLGSSINITGNVGTIQSSGSLGSLGDTLTVNGNVTKLLVGGDLRSNVRVTGNLKNLTVKGSIVDGGIEDGLVIDVSNTLNTLNVAFDIQQGVEVNARAIKKQKIGGQNLGEFNIVQ